MSAPLALNTVSAMPDPAGPAGRLGRVIAVSGGKVVGLLERSGAGPETARAPHIGELVKIVTENSTVFGFVTGIGIDNPLNRELELRRVELELASTTRPRWSRSTAMTAVPRSCLDSTAT